MASQYKVSPIIGQPDMLIAIYRNEELTDQCGAVAAGTLLTINDTSVGKANNAYFASNLPWDNGNKGAYISRNNVETIDAEDNAEELAEWIQESSAHLEYFDNYAFSEDAEDAEWYKMMTEKINYAFGCPPKYNQDVDIQYDVLTSDPGGKSHMGIGRIMQKTFYDNPTILSICPGKVKLFPSLFGIKKDNAVETMINAISGADSGFIEKLKSDTSALNSGQMYRFRTDTQEFGNRVNLLCRACAQLLKLQDTKMPRTNTPLNEFDYAYWSIRKNYSPDTGDKDPSFWKEFAWGGVEGAITDKNYIHFVISNNGSSISETISTNVEENSILSGLKSTVNSATASLSYFLDSGFNETSDLAGDITGALSSGGVAENWQSFANNLLEGGQMVFPDQITGVNFAQSYSCSLTFISPYGDPLSVFLWCIVPVMHLLALALPKQVADNVYTFPFLCKVVQKGWFNSDLAAITDLQITRGGGDDTSWTREGLTTEWTVSFTVAPLVSSLMVPSTAHPMLFMKNDGIIDYLGNLCGFDLKANNFDTKVDLFWTFTMNKFKDRLSLKHTVSRWWNDKFSELPVWKLFRLG